MTIKARLGTIVITQVFNMRQILVLVLFFLISSFYSCSVVYNAYIRNMTNEAAIINVFILEKRSMYTLPNKIKIANMAVKFKGGYKKYFDETQNVIWLTTEHFKFEMKPNMTADLSDLAGKFINSHPTDEVRVTVQTTNRTDTLLNGGIDFRYNLFQFKSMGFASPVIYYDIK